MGLLRTLIIVFGVLIAVFIGYKLQSFGEDAPVPVLPTNVWWGTGDRRVEDETVRQFKIQVAEEVIIDLKTQLDRFLKRPLTSPLENVGFQYGFNTDYLRTVIRYWKDTYLSNWIDRLKYLNSIPQYTTRVNGLKIHYVRVTPRAPEGKRVLPLLLLHGWPGSIREFYEVIPLLTQPNDNTDFVFEVIAPSLPGYGFSEGAAKPGMGPAEVAVLMKNLMTKLGFQSYYVQGGDWGAIIGKTMAQLYPKTVLGLHSNMCSINSPYSNFLIFLGSFCPSLIVNKEHEHLIYPFSKRFFGILEETGYFHIQATKPDTIGTALSDTPAGLAAYILEKFSTWTKNEYKELPDGGLTKKYTLDSLLDNIMIYLLSNSITTSQRLYSEAFTFKQMALRLDEVPIIVPSACARFHNDLVWQPETLLKLQHRNLVQITDYPDGGHFAAMEHPKLLASDIISAIQKMEISRKNRKN